MVQASLLRFRFNVELGSSTILRIGGCLYRLLIAQLIHAPPNNSRILAKCNRAVPSPAGLLVNSWKLSTSVKRDSRSFIKELGLQGTGLPYLRRFAQCVTVRLRFARVIPT